MYLWISCVWCTPVVQVGSVTRALVRGQHTDKLGNNTWMVKLGLEAANAQSKERRKTG